MLMNLTRIRQFDWQNQIVATYNVYKSKLKLHDQDIVNIIFHENPDKMYLLPCHANFMYPRCPEVMEKCRSAVEEGIMAVHGIAGSFTTFPTFKAINDAFTEVNFLFEVLVNILKLLLNFLNYCITDFCIFVVLLGGRYSLFIQVFRIKLSRLWY